MRRGRGAVDRQKPSGRKALGIGLLAFGVVVLACVVIFLSFPGAFLQRFVEGRITKSFAASYPGYAIRVSGMRFDIMKNRIACDSVNLARNDSSFSGSIAMLSVSGVHWQAGGAGMCRLASGGEPARPFPSIPGCFSWSSDQQG
jgi:hypothetical protein